MFKQLRLYEYGSIDSLVLETVEREPLNLGEARILVKASALNRDQLPFIKGEWAGGVKEIENHTKLGYEAAGVVIEVADDVSAEWIGKEVLPIGSFDVTRYGTEGEEAVVPADRLIEKPENMNFIDGTAIWVPYLTAYGMLMDGHLKPGDYVLISAANSVVGHAARAIAKSLGAFPISLVRSEERQAELRSQGEQHVFLQDEELTEKIASITNGYGIDLVFDALGGKYLKKFSALSAENGYIVEYGVLGGIELELSAFDLLSKKLTISGYTLDKLFADKIEFEHAKTFILENVQKGRFQAKVSAVYDLEEYKKAYQDLEKGHHTGRIVLQVRS